MDLVITLDYIWLPMNRAWVISARATREGRQVGEATHMLDVHEWDALDAEGKRKLRIDMLSALEDEIHRREQEEAE